MIVDFHAEATSEKVALARYLDGRATAVLGTHTHVQTNDARVLAGGTAAITDAGMTGPHDSVIGSEEHGAIKRFVTGMPVRLEPADRRRPHRGRARRVRRRRARDELHAGPRQRRARKVGSASTASSATSTRSRSSTTPARWKRSA